MRCVLHVGTIKTGTTAIQESFARRPPEGARLFQARNGLSNSSLILSSAYETDPARHARFHPRAAGHDPAVRARFLEMLDASVAEAPQGVHTLVISAERAFIMSEGALRDLASDLSARFERVQVAAYVRPFAGFVSSAFQESIKHRHRRLGDLKAPMQEPRLRLLDDIFGRENAVFAPFDRERMEGGDVVSDFAARLGLRHEAADTVRVNESLSREGTALLYALRLSMAARPGGAGAATRMDEDLLDLCRALGGGRFSLGPGVLAPLTRRIAPQAPWICERIGYPVERFLRLPDEGVETEADLLAPLSEPQVRERIAALLEGAELSAEGVGLIADALSPPAPERRAEPATDTEETPMPTQTDETAKPDPALRRQVARALWRIERSGDLDPEARKAAWQAQRKEMTKKAARLIGQLSRSGIDVTFSRKD